MEVTRIHFSVDTLGTTQKSLKVLRDTIAERADHRLAVVEVPVNDLRCGFSSLT